MVVRAGASTRSTAARPTQRPAFGRGGNCPLADEGAIAIAGSLLEGSGAGGTRAGEDRGSPSTRLALQISVAVTALATIAASIFVYAAVWAPKSGVTQDELSAAVYRLDLAVHRLQAAQDRAVRPSDLAALMQLVDSRLSCLEKFLGTVGVTRSGALRERPGATAHAKRSPAPPCHHT